MIARPEKIKALGLCSGGLDSILAGLVLRRQGIHVEWITFETPFFSAEKARQAAKQTGIPLTEAPITPVYLEMLKNPNCGYGKHMNPCMDCHALMFRLAGEKMESDGFHFLFSGEVLAQRPMSQTRPSLRYVEKHSGRDGYILRPLSARKLPETIPEQKGWVDREALLDLAGRSRKPQIRLAEEFGVTHYPAPAGGCLLTDAGFCRRLKDLFDHQETFTEAELHLLKHGRHFRLDSQSKIVVGRTKTDNENIHALYDPDADVMLKTMGWPGPIVLAPNGGVKSALLLAAAICAGYTKAPKDAPAEVRISSPGKQEHVKTLPLSGAEVRHLMI
ncbi:MAG: tRNA 4-thiouridine(8) synthase ThiI [Desulfobacterales bacterium]|nr:tRNA 4-thiouridine(8) synthase ThiI [Desulfobacterales bacterium]